MSRFTVVHPSVDLGQPTESLSGRYWYNLHLVFVVRDRRPVFDGSQLTAITIECSEIAREQGYSISRQSLLPDHLHLSLRGNIEQSPEQIALTFLNQLSACVGKPSFWDYGYYAGNFGEYDMDSVRFSRTADCRSD